VSRASGRAHIIAMAKSSRDAGKGGRWDVAMKWGIRRNDKDNVQLIGCIREQWLSSCCTRDAKSIHMRRMTGMKLLPRLGGHAKVQPPSCMAEATYCMKALHGASIASKGLHGNAYGLSKRLQLGTLADRVLATNFL